MGSYADPKTANYEGMFRNAAERQMRGRSPTSGPVIVHLVAVFEVPGSYSKKRKLDCLEMREFPAKAPDLDNILKAGTDAFNKIIYADDKQIISQSATKIYGERPRVDVVVTEL